MSMTYHMLEAQSYLREEVLRRLDHAAIFILIAGTFTAVHGIVFRGWRRWVVIVLVWFFVAIVVPIKMFYFHEMPESLGLALYLGFGWVGLFSGILLYRQYGLRLILPLVFGGLAYTVGAVAEYDNTLTIIPGTLGAHEFFHIAVLAGLGFHWWFAWQVANRRFS